MNFNNKYVFGVMFVIFSFALCTHAKEPKKFLPECENIVAKNHEGFNAYLAHDNTRYDYCCMVSEGFYVKEDCKPEEPNTTVKEPCPYGTFAEVSHGSQQCVRWACIYNGREIMFDIDSREFKVTTGGSATSDIKCSCTPDKYLYVDTDIEVAYCMNRVKVCPPGEGVSVKATLYSDIQCAPCKDGEFQSEYTKTGKCEDHTKCSGLIKVHGNSTDDTECLKPGDKIVPVTTTTATTLQPTTTTTTPQPTTTTTTTQPTTTTTTTQPTTTTTTTTTTTKPTTTTTTTIIVIVKIVGVVFLLTIFVFVVWCCKDKFCPSRSSKSIISSNSAETRSNRQDSLSERSGSGTLATSSRASTPVAQREEFRASDQVANPSSAGEQESLLRNVIVEDTPSTSTEQPNKCPVTNKEIVEERRKNFTNIPIQAETCRFVKQSIDISNCKDLTININP